MIGNAIGGVLVFVGHFPVDTGGYFVSGFFAAVFFGCFVGYLSEAASFFSPAQSFDCGPASCAFWCHWLASLIALVTWLWKSV